MLLAQEGCFSAETKAKSPEHSKFTRRTKDCGLIHSHSVLEVYRAAFAGSHREVLLHGCVMVQAERLRWQLLPGKCPQAEFFMSCCVQELQLWVVR